MVAVSVYDVARLSRSGIRPARRAALAWLALLSVLLAWQLLVRRDAWREAHNWEPGDIGQSLAEGHGYSLPPGHRWHFEGEPGNAVYGATAWAEPGQTLLVAAAWRLADRADPRPLVVAAACLFLLATAGVLLTLGWRLFGSPVGMLASLLLLQPQALDLATATLTAAPLVGLAVTVGATVMLWCLARPSPLRAAALGAVLGAGVLVSGCTLLSLPIALGGLLARGGRGRRARLVSAAAAIAAFVLVCAPWWVRNYAVFHRFIPARSGFGQIAQVGNPILASTFMPAAVPCPGRQAPWRASGALDAVIKARLDAFRVPLERLGHECMRDAAGADYARLDEVQRDAVAQRQFTAFAWSHPALLARLLAAKTVAFFWKWPGDVRLLLLLSIAGAVLTRRRAPCRLLLVCVLAFAVPYLVTMPYSTRYRYPIEPLLLLFASYPIVLVASRCLTLERQAAAHPADAGSR